MLRIKADRMKDLEKFGFEKFPEKHNLVFRHCSKYDCNKYALITVNTKTRELNINTPMGTAAFPEVYNEEYQDLIKADMVEEVLYDIGGIMTNGDKIRKAITDEWLAWYINYYFDADMQNNVILQQVPRNLMDCNKCRYNDAEKEDCKNGADCSPIILDWLKEQV